tara:strand:- start:390 stop:941 length:552 start_codon:yes stop_codon:yes gene_type:complete
MIIPNKAIVIKYLTNGIIAPHGITDYIHAIDTNNKLQLNLIYLTTTSSCLYLDIMNQNFLINSMFILTSVVHFQRDFPINDNNFRYFLTFLLLILSIEFNIDLLYLYMIFLHVPNHYKMNMDLLKKYTKESIITISLCSFLFLLIGDKYDNIFYGELINFVKGIIISHILYGELYIYREKIEN